MPEVTFPKLYKRNNTGKLQEWEIKALLDGSGGEIVTTFGQVGGKMQTTSDVISEGKNQGRANATTAAQQAEAEARAKWEKQKKKGYIENIDLAAQGVRDSEVIKGGVDPMLAQSYDKHAQKVEFPAAFQPKLDGIRCIATIAEGKATLWTRTRKPILSVPHIVAELEKLFSGQTLTLDGELYNHALKNDFEKIVSVVRTEKEVDAEMAKVIEYHVYDVIADQPFINRYGEASMLIEEEGAQVKAVETLEINSAEEVESATMTMIQAGFEGGMVRNLKYGYESKRSFHLQKVKRAKVGTEIKTFEEEEFEITGISEGKGKLRGHVAAFVCKQANGPEFKAKLKGDTAKLKEYFENSSLWQGKKLTVQFQGRTKYGAPRFPVGKAIRDYE